MRQLVTDGAVYRGRVRPASALAEYVMDTVNPGLEPGSKVSWEDVITRTPWMSKRLHGMTTRQEQTVRRQALPMLRRDRRIVITVQVRSRSELIGWIRVLVSPSPNLTENIHLSRWTHPGWMNHSPGWSWPSQSLSSHLKPRRRTPVRRRKMQKRKYCKINCTVGLEARVHVWIRVATQTKWSPYGTLGGMLVILPWA